MPSFFARPPLVRPARGHSILTAQSCWFVDNDAGRVPHDILQGAYAAGSLGSGITHGNSPWGRAFLGDASATSIIDLGSTNRFIASTTQPFTVSWIEHHAGSQTYAGLMLLMPTGAATNTGFFVLRTNDNTVGAGNYGRLACSTWGGTNVVVAFLGPPAVNDNVPHVFVLTGSGGPTSNTLSDWNLYWESGQQISATGTATGGAFGGTANSFGWDGADSKWQGVFDNLRVWNRVLSDAEIKKVIVDPYYGCARSSLWPAGFSSFVAPPVTGDQSRFFLGT